MSSRSRARDALIAGALALAAPCGTWAAGIAEGRIKEGSGVAGAKLGMTAAEVEEKLGTPVRVNRTPEGELLVMFYHDERIFDLYMNEDGRVDMMIVSVEGGVFCTRYKVCLYEEGHLTKLKSRHGRKLLRFVDRDGSATYRLLKKSGGRQIMTEWTPNEERDGLVQVMMMYWEGPIDRSSFD